MSTFHEKMTAIADRIRFFNGATQKMNLNTIPDNIDHVYDHGKDAERDAFWETFQLGGTVRYYSYAFYGDMWRDDNYDPKYPIITKNMNSGFATNHITDTKVDIEFITGGNNSLNSLFSGCSKLETVRKIIVHNALVYSKGFDGCTSLKNLTFAGVIGQNGLNVSVCPLTHESLMSIINCLEAKTSGTWTVTLGTDNLAKLTEAEKAIATEKGWTLA